MEHSREEVGRGRAYKTVMIDQGFCFNAGEWNFPDAPLRDAGVEAVPLDGLAVWTAKMRPMIQ